MAYLLILGAIPSGLAGTATTANGLYCLRFFIGILGATFVPCQAWTTAFFDKNVVGTANALVGGWGNMGGGATFAIMTTLFQALTDRHHLTPHVAWRAAFAIVPVAILLFVALITFMFGQDHPAGTWKERHNLPATALALKQGHEIAFDSDEKLPDDIEKNEKDPEAAVTVRTVNEEDAELVKSTLDIAINERLTFKTTMMILISPLTWLPAMAYITTFGVELAIDSKMADVLFTLFNKKLPGFDQTRAGYYTAIFGLLNLVTRPLGGYIGDVLYRYTGTVGKKYWTLFCGFTTGVGLLAGGFYLQEHRVAGDSELSVIMGVFSVVAIFSEFGCGATFALVPHCNPYNNGVMSGIVGSFGNVGGVIFALVFRFQHQVGKAFWIMGVIAIAINVILIPIRVPKL